MIFSAELPFSGMPRHRFLLPVSSGLPIPKVYLHLRFQQILLFLQRPAFFSPAADIYFQNLRVIPRDLFGLDLRLGAEINIIDYNGTLDLGQEYIDRLDFVIAGIHSVCYKFGSKEENTAAIINAIKNPNVNIISHPDDGRCPLDYEALVQAAKEYHVLLEINNNALRDKNRKNVKENQKLIIENCKKYNHPFIMGSDAHFTTDIANYDHCGPLIESMNVDNELIMNYYPDRLREFLRKQLANICTVIH